MLRNLLENVKWFWVTRGIGVTFALYGLLIDRSTERGTIILTGAGFLGFDRVAGKGEK